MESNIDKKRFNKLFAEYILLTKEQESHRFYSRHIHQDIITIIGNATYKWNFDTEFRREDVEAELLYHLQYKLPNLQNYKGNWYNIVFTCMRNRFYDLCRMQKVRDKRNKQLLDLMQKHQHLLEKESDD